MNIESEDVMNLDDMTKAEMLDLILADDDAAALFKGMNPNEMTQSEIYNILADWIDDGEYVVML